MADLWYYTRHGKSHGPVQAPQLKQLAVEEKIHPFDFIWKEGLPQWVPATSVKGLFTPEQLRNPNPRPEALRVDAISADYSKAERQREDQEDLRRAPPAPDDRRDRGPDDDFDFDERDRGRGRDRNRDRDRDRDDDRGRGGRRPRGRKRGKGMSKGLLIGLIAGGGGGLVLIIVLIIVLMFAFGGHGKKGDTRVTLSREKMTEMTFSFPDDTTIEFDIEADDRTSLVALIYQGSFRMPTTKAEFDMMGGRKADRKDMPNFSRKDMPNFSVHTSFDKRMKFRYRTRKSGTHRLYMTCNRRDGTSVRIRWQPAD